MPNIALIEGNKLSDSGSDLTAISGQTYSRLHSGRDFPNGTLIETTIDYSLTNGDPWVLEITGNSYFSLTPFDLTYQGYIYNNTMIAMGGMSTGTTITGMSLFNYNGKLCFWFPSQGYWQGFNVFVYTAQSGRKENRVTAISNVAKPAGITKELSMTFQQVVRTSSSTVGTANYVPKFTGNGILADSQIFDNGTNIGIGVTPVATTLGRSLSIGSVGNGLFSYDVGNSYLTQNTYYNGAWKYANTAPAAQYILFGGEHLFSTAPSGTAGNNVTLTERMRITQGGNVGIGTDNPSGRLDVNGATSYFGTNGTDTVVYLRGYNAGLTKIQNNSGVSANYNGLSIHTNHTNANSLPSWFFDFGGHDGITFIQDAFTISRKPSGGSFTTLFTVLGSGPVLVGGTTNVGSHRLQVSGNISINGSGTYLDFANGDVRLINSGGNLSIQTYSASTTLTTKMYISGTGNVGINNTAPYYLLDVNGNIGIRDGNYLYMGHTSLGTNWTVRTRASGSQFQVDAASFRFADVGYTNAITWIAGIANGNVGIGTGSPTARLNVEVNVAAASTPAASMTFSNSSDGGHRVLFKSSTGDLVAIDGDVTSTGGGTNDGVLKFWTSVDGVLSERMRISSGGNVTITNLAGTGTRIVVADASGVLSATTVSSSLVGGSGTVNRVAKFTATGTVGDSQIFDNGTSVGIGTVSPAAKLDIRGTSTQDIYLISTTASNVENSIQSYFNNGGGWANFGIKSQNLILYTGPSGGPQVERLYITSTGNVGIGTTSPTIPRGSGFRPMLHVYDNVAGTNPAVVVSCENSQKAGFIAGDNAGASDIGWGFNAYYEGNGNNFFNVRIGDNGVWTDRFTIDRFGNVGVGTTAPSFRLDVQGGLANFAQTASSGSAFRWGSYGTAVSPDTMLCMNQLWNGSSWTYINNTVGTTAINLGSAVASPDIKFDTGGAGVLATTKVIILNNGNVGIGTTAPSYNLQVGSGTTAGNRTLAVQDSGYGVMLSGGGGAANNYIQSIGTTIPLYFRAGNSNDANYIFSSTGRMGIGSTSPGGRVHIRQAASEIPLIIDSSVGTNAAFTQYQVNASSGWEVGMAGSGDSFKWFFSYGGFGSANAKVAITSGGNFGIGQVSPQRPLHITTANGTASQIQIGQTSQRDYYIGIPASQTYLDFYDASAGASRMAIFSDGNVAINTLSNAGYKFDVNGTTRFGGTTTFNSTIVQKNFSSIIISNLSASATQARQFEILRGFYDYNDWSSSIGVVEIEVYENYFSRGLKKVYTFTYGYFDSSNLALTEMTGTGDNLFRVTMGAKVLISGDMYYVPVYLEVRYYASVDVVIRTRRTITTNNLSTNPGNLYVNESPTAVNISDFTSDTTVYPNNAAANQVVLGNLGIGSNPSYKLDVDGVARFRNFVRFKTDVWNLSDEGQSRLYFGNAGSTFYGTGSSHIWRNSSDTTLMTLLSSGNLGINTTTPAGLLDISGGSYNTGLIVRSSSANGSGVAILNSSAGGKHWYIISTGGNNGGGAGNLGFYNDSDGDYRVYFSAAGNVGISTTSPGYKLEVVGQGGSYGTTIMARATTDDPGITAYSTSTTGKPHIKLLNGLYSHKIWLAGDGTGDLYFSVDYAATTPKVVFKGNGNVGIGTISPVFVAGGGLHVKMAGDANIRITGGSNTGFDLTQASDGNNYIYNRDNSAFIFGTNNTERVRIAADGKLIVNSASSFGAYQFQVNGAAYISGQTTLANLAGTGSRMVVTDANGLLSTQAIPSGGGSGTVTSVGLTTGTSGTDVNVSNSPITSSGNITLNIPDASATARGLVTTGAQTFAGDKTFTGTTTLNSTRTSITNGSYGMYMLTTYNVSTATSNVNVYTSVDALTLNLTNGALTGNETFNVTANLNQVGIAGNAGTVSTQPIRGIISGLLGIPGAIAMNIADYRYFEAKTPDRAALTGHVVQTIYGLKISQLRGATGFTITNGWGIYQEGSQDNNYFNGSVVIGSATVGSYKLDVTNNFRVNTGTVPVAIESFANPGIGTVASVYSTGTNSTIAFGSQANDTYLVGGYVFIGNQSAKFLIQADTLTGGYDGWGSIGSSSKYMKEVYTNYLVAKATFNRQTGSYTLVLGDAGKVIEMNVGSANTLTVPTNASVALPIGTQIRVVQYGAGQTTIGGAGVTFRSRSGWLKISAQYGRVELIKVGTDEWYVIGDLAA